MVFSVFQMFFSPDDLTIALVLATSTYIHIPNPSVLLSRIALDLVVRNRPNAITL